jgi:hypothetical protein
MWGAWKRADYIVKHCGLSERWENDPCEPPELEMAHAQSSADSCRDVAFHVGALPWDDGLDGATYDFGQPLIAAAFE